ncbi:PIN-like domain-containing protein [Microbacterium sp. W1N]|uniref:PIN-like domain-containing protein n=1 Tax=Microbacterium festucae TaxID=2977531 RepID=UPI0021C1CB06|nr:PIN-like domain-containing protein [Microbacterium festucae]MCT9820799.1 PIN-like domain-containing protein [Microbacterium festucae]
MRKEFPGYYPPTEEEDAELWSSGLIVFDSSALLSLFRYSGHTRTEYLKLLNEKSDQLWIPFHVGVEYHRNHLTVLSSQNQAFDEIEKAIEEAEAKVRTAVDRFKRHPSLSTADLPKHLKKSSKRLRKALREAREAHTEFAESHEGHEKTFDAVTALYEGHVGRRWSEEELAKVYVDGAARFENKVPPGFKDSDKPGNDQYGDLVIWLQIIEHATESGRAVIFVTDDLKEDWWRIVGGKRLGARVELVDEFSSATGKRIHFYTPDRFLETARRKGSDIGDEAVEEVQQVSRARLVPPPPPSGTGASMDRVIADIPPEQLEALRQALREITMPNIDPAAAAAVGRAMAEYLAHIKVPNIDWSNFSNYLAHTLTPEEQAAARHDALLRRLRRPTDSSRATGRGSAIEGTTGASDNRDAEEDGGPGGDFRYDEP